jgi:LacI family transcriptional regulator
VVNLAVTIEDVAKAAGVSKSTASRVLGKYGYVSDETRRKVLEAARVLNYRPHALAKSLVTGRTGTIGLLVADIENPFFARIARGVSDAISPEDYDLIVCSTNENLLEECHAVRTLRNKQVDGMVIAPATTDDYSHIEELAEEGIPMVLVDRFIESLKLDCVAVTNAEGTREAIDHLAGLGHLRIAFLGDSTSTTHERLDGYRQAMAEHGFSMDDRLVRITDYPVQSGYREAISLLCQDSPPTAVFAASNFMTIGALQAARDMNIRIPDELSIVGFDDLEWYGFVAPPITAVRQPVYELGRIAAQSLLQRINGDNSRPAVLRLPTRLIVRKSSGKASG